MNFCAARSIYKDIFYWVLAECVFPHKLHFFFFFTGPLLGQSISLKCCEMVVNQIANPLWYWVSALIALQKVNCHVTGRCEPYGPQWEPLFSGDTGSLGPLTSSLFKVREMPSKNSCERTKTGQKERRTLWNHMHIFCQEFGVKKAQGTFTQILQWKMWDADRRIVNLITMFLKRWVVQEAAKKACV